MPSDDPHHELRARLAARNALFGLCVRTPRLTLRMPTDPELLELLDVIEEGIHDPSWMPFRKEWTDVPPPRRDRESLAHWWRLRTEWAPSAWTWCGAVRVDGRLVGVQDLMATDFAALHEVRSGSWLGRSVQGQGLGKEMRAAILHLAFDGLGAQRAHSGYVEGNEASHRVSAAMGYVANGSSHFVSRGEVRRELHVVLERDVWARQRRADVVVEGLAPCLELFGAAPT